MPKVVKSCDSQTGSQRNLGPLEIVLGNYQSGTKEVLRPTRLGDFCLHHPPVSVSTCNLGKALRAVVLKKRVDSASPNHFSNLLDRAAIHSFVDTFTHSQNVRHHLTHPRVLWSRAVDRIHDSLPEDSQNHAVLPQCSRWGRFLGWGWEMPNQEKNQNFKISCHSLEYLRSHSPARVSSDTWS